MKLSGMRPGDRVVVTYVNSTLREKGVIVEAPKYDPLLQAHMCVVLTDEGRRRYCNSIMVWADTAS